MTTGNAEIRSVHANYCAWLDRNPGMPSAVKHPAILVKMNLQGCLINEGAFIGSLWQQVERLKAALAVATS